MSDVARIAGALLTFTLRLQDNGLFRLADLKLPDREIKLQDQQNSGGTERYASAPDRGDPCSCPWTGTGSGDRGRVAAHGGARPV